VSRRIFFDVWSGNLAIARLRARSGGRRQAEQILRFSFPVPAQNGRSSMDLSIESRPVGYVETETDPRIRAAKEAVPFRLVGAWIL
jgi:hypothetical protein